jgi:DNA-binding NtrC family response regulator
MIIMSKQVILCVDDEYFLLKSLKEEILSMKEDLLLKVGLKFEIILAESADIAMEILDRLNKESREVPIIIADHIMPVKNGDEMLKEIHEKYPHSVKIMLSGQASIEGVINSINNAQLYKCIEKPWSKEELEKVIVEAYSKYENSQTLDKEKVKLTKELTELQKIYPNEKIQ